MAPILGVRVKLTCGHWIPARIHPLNRTTRFGCTMGLGCGYRLRWVRWADDQRNWLNPDFDEQKQEFTP